MSWMLRDVGVLWKVIYFGEKMSRILFCIVFRVKKLGESKSTEDPAIQEKPRQANRAGFRVLEVVRNKK